jgi:hypothetical protein
MGWASRFHTDVHWSAPADENPADIWFRADPVTGSHELRRITTRWLKSAASGMDKGPRVDFFEFYWADLAEGTTVEEVWDWLRTLLVRWPSQVPSGLMAAWLLLWAAAASIGVLSLFAVLPWPGGWWHAALGVAAAVMAALMQYVVSPYIGDVARYVRADPRNIAMRAAIRDRGLKLLKDLHDRGSYERIIVVAHSLGTIIGYDLICLLWAERQSALILREGEPAFQDLRAAEIAAHELANSSGGEMDEKRRAYREAQRVFRQSLRSGGASGAGPKRAASQEWLISDFVTLGAPLTHAQFLLARNPGDLRNKIDRWLYPTNRPQFERIESEQLAKINDRPTPPSSEILGPPSGLFSYFLRKPETWAVHDAAPFAAVRWTNIYDSHRLIFQGDIVSGPLAPVFGGGIRDIDLKDLRGQSRVFSHTLYWALPSDRAQANSLPHIAALHKALDLLDRPDREIWH